MPEIDLLAFGEGYHTFAAKRFDRDGAERRLFASAMPLLDQRDRAEDVSYLDLADAIERYGSPTKAAIDADLEELFRRVVFNALAGHRDDHLRNHGFLHDGSGWRLAPAFDLNPIPDKQEHELSFDGQSTLPDLELIMATARLYRLSTRRAETVVAEVTDAVKSWRAAARAAGLNRDKVDPVARRIQQCQPDSSALRRGGGLPTRFGERDFVGYPHEIHDRSGGEKAGADEHRDVERTC